jgi:hypothetical protein
MLSGNLFQFDEYHSQASLTQQQQQQQATMNADATAVGGQ